MTGATTESAGGGVSEGIRHGVIATIATIDDMPLAEGLKQSIPLAESFLVARVTYPTTTFGRNHRERERRQKLGKKARLKSKIEEESATKVKM